MEDSFLIKSNKRLKIWTLATAQLISSQAMADSSIEVFSPFVDSEHANLFYVSPEMKLAFGAKSKDFFATSVRLNLVNTSSENDRLHIEPQIAEAAVSSDFSRGRATLGRIYIRPELHRFNDSTRLFLLAEPSVDGLHMESELESVRFGFFAGGPRVLGFHMRKDFSGVTGAIFYRNERNRLSNFMPTDNLNPDEKTWRAAHTHEGEIFLKVSTERFHVDGLIQIMQKSQQRKVKILNRQWGAIAIGETDLSLPKAFLDYRSATQIKTLLSRREEFSDWLMIAFASQNSVRYYSGSEEERNLKQSASSSSQVTVAFENSSPRFSTQTGISGEFAGSKKFGYLAQQTSAGDAQQVKSKVSLWFSTGIHF